VHELGAHGATIQAACPFGVLSRDLQLGMGNRFLQAERVKVGLEISPLPERSGHALAFRSPGFLRLGGGGTAVCSAFVYGHSLALFL
jgi:hypothetical protein